MRAQDYENNLMEIRLTALSSPNEKISTGLEKLEQSAADFSIEFCHLNIARLHLLSMRELTQRVVSEKNKLDYILKSRKLAAKSVSVCVLVDDKNNGNTKSLNYLIAKLTELGVDFIAYESNLKKYLKHAENIFSRTVYKEFTEYLSKHKQLGCSQDIFIWYCLRLGVIDYRLVDNAIIPISRNAKDHRVDFVGKSLLMLLNKDYKEFEDRADSYFKKVFRFPPQKLIRREYY